MSWIFNFDRSDFGVRVRRGEDGLWRWQLVSPRPELNHKPDPANDLDWIVRALPPVRDAHESHGAAYRDARDVVEGLGADFRDLTAQERAE